MLRSPAANCARSTFLSNLPTLVFGTSSMNAHRSGTCHFGIAPAKNSRSTSADAVEPGHKTTHASGRSSQRGSGTPTTLASATSG